MSGRLWQRVHLGLSPDQVVMDLSSEELKILEDDQFLLLKNQVGEKIISALADIERALRKEVGQSTFSFPEGTFLKAGKISKGEQYRMLPYFILDYPRLFSRKEVFAFRVMLWWGNHFSCTLHLSGAYLELHKKALATNIPGNENLWFCVNNHPWDYHFEADNYRPAKHLTQEIVMLHIEKTGFIKISDYLPLDQWQAYKSFTLRSFARFLRYIN